MEPTRDTSQPAPEQTIGSVQATPSTEAPSFLIPATEVPDRPDLSTYSGPGAAAAGSTKPDITKPNTLDAPFNGVLQPADSAAINQGPLLDDISSSMPNDPLPEPPKPIPRARLIGLGLVSIGLLAAIILGVRIELNKTHAQEARFTSPSDQIKAQQLPTSDLSKQLGTAQSASAVTVNGQLQVTNSLVLQPSTLTGPAVTGEMYYNSATNLVTYYNGKQYVTLQGGGNTYITNNATGNTTNITNNTFITNNGGGFSGTGIPGRLALFASSTTLGNSLLVQNGGAVSIGSNSISVGTGSGLAAIQGSNGGVSLVTTANASGASGDVTIQSGDSATTASGNVIVDTGTNTINGLQVADYDFETGLTGSFTNQGVGQFTSTQDCTVAHTGRCSMNITGSDFSGGGNWVFSPQSSIAEFAVTPGHHYVFSFWVKAASTSTQILAQIENDTGCGNSSGEFDNSTTWTQITWSCTIPAGYTHFGFQVGFVAQLPQTHYYDDITATDVSSSSSTAALNLGVTNAQAVTIGNLNETGTTSIIGGTGISLNSGLSALTANGGSVGVTSGSSISLAGGLGDVTITTAGNTNRTGNITIESGDSSTTASGNITVDTGSGFVSGTVTSNFNFEDNTTEGVTSWFGDTIATTNTMAHGGTYGLAMTTTGAFWGIILNGNVVTMPVTAGHHVFFSAWVRAATSPRTIGGQLAWVGGGAVSMTSITDSTSGWTQMSVSATVPAGVTAATFDFSGSGTGVGEVHYFDDITMTDLSSSSSTASLNLGSANAQIVTIGNLNELGATTINGGSGITMNSGSGPLNVNAGAITITGTAASSIGTSLGSLTLNSGGGTGGGVIVKPGQDSTTAFQVQNTAGNAALNVDSAHGIVTVNTASNCSYAGYGSYLTGLSPSADWKLEDLGSTAADSSGNGNGGTLSNVTTNVTPGPFSCDTTHPGMGFNGASPSKITTTVSAVSPSAYTQVVMFKTTTALGTFIGYAGGGNHDREFGVDGSGRLWARIYNNSLGDENLSSSKTVTDGNWHVAAVTVSASGMDLYLDGTLVASNASYNAPQSYTGSWLLGGGWGVSGAPYTGDLAQVAVFTSALTGIQVQSLASDSGFYAGSLASIGIGTTTPAANLDVEGNALLKNGVDSTAAFQIQNSSGVSLLTADTANMTIDITGSLAVTGHIITGGSTPTIAAGPGACTGPTVSVTGNDTAGTVTINTGTGCSGGGTLATLTFVSAFSKPPTVVLTPGSSISQTLGAYVDDSTISTTKFDIGTNTTPTSTQTFKWNYFVVQ